ncbi:MAG: CDP-alcohol phosphatidyltransferase family protein [Dehalococcoidia bacterium]
MLNLLPQDRLRRLAQPVALALARTGITPNTVTMAGVLGNVGAAALLARGKFLPGGALVLAASALDAVDGALARATGRSSVSGAVLDAVMDRVSEAAVLLGLLVFYSGRGRREEEILCSVAMAGSLLVSYVRARAEAQGLPLREGLFTRTERVTLLGVGLIMDQVRIALWLLAVLSNGTAVQRLYVAWLRATQGNGPPASPARQKAGEETGGRAR